MQSTRTINVPARGVGYQDHAGIFMKGRRGLGGQILGCDQVLKLLHSEGAGGVVHDTSGYGQDMHSIHAPVWSTLASGQNVLGYDGLNDYLICSAAGAAMLDFTTEKFTFLVWCQPNVFASDMLLTKGRVDVSGYEFYLTEVVNTISLRTNQLGSHTGISAVGAYTPGAWQLIGVTRNGATGQFYVNGTQVATSLGAGLADPVSGAGHDFLIAKGELGNYYNGKLGIIKIWARELSAAEILSVFTLERSLFGV